MRRIACAFCPALVDLTPTTFKDADEGEHLWPDWLNRAFRDARIAPPQYKFHTMHRGQLSVRPKQSINYKQPVVCTKCNNEWMSVLEQQARKILIGSVVADAPFNVSGANSERLALWAVKSAVVLDHTHLIAQSRTRPFYMPAERFALRHGVLPRDVTVTIFRNSGATFTLARATYSGSTPKTRESDIKNREVYAATFAYGRVGFHIVKFKFQNPRKRSGSAVAVAPEGWADHRSQLLPLPTEDCNWPPRYSLDFTGMWQFAHQWVDHTPDIPEPADVRR
jgi:hypothetical protein